MPGPARRIHQRFACDLPVEVYSPVTETKLAEGRLVNVGMGGAAIVCSLGLQKGVPYELRLAWLKHRLRLTGRVVWVGDKDPKSPRHDQTGISFNLTTRQEEVLKLLIDRLRQDQAPQKDVWLKDYWSR